MRNKTVSRQFSRRQLSGVNCRWTEQHRIRVCFHNFFNHHAATEGFGSQLSRGQYLGVNCPGVNFPFKFFGSQFSGDQFSGSQFSTMITGESIFWEPIFHGCQFSGVSFPGINCLGSQLLGVNFLGVNWWESIVGEPWMSNSPWCIGDWYDATT